MDKIVATELSSTYEIDFCNDYLAFLNACNGFNFDEISIDGIRSYPPDIGHAEQVRYLFGIGSGDAHTDMAIVLPGMTNYLGKKYLRFCYPVGEGPGGDMFVQIHKGAERGHVMLVDHEVHITPDKFVETYGSDMDEYDVDGFVQWLCSFSFNRTADSFDEFLRQLVAVREEHGPTRVMVVAKPDGH